MATREQVKKQFDQRRNRYFSERFKKQKVKEIEKNQKSVREVSQLYEVSLSSVYRWVYKYSSLYQKGLKQVIEPMSDARKLKALQERIKELEQVVGRKQIQLEFTQKMIELAEEHYGIEIKKKWFPTLRWFWYNREAHRWKMNQIYRVIGTSKQNMHQRLNHYLGQEETKALLHPLLDELRQEHPRMGAKLCYLKRHPEGMGQDRFLGFYAECGLKLDPTRNPRKTTNSNGVIRFPNLLAGRELSGVNQGFVSDITYYELNGRFHYLTFIMDVYSRMIKGFSASQTLKTTFTTIPALQMVLKGLPAGPPRPIFHSDGGGQYYSKEFLALTKGRFRNSKAQSVYENAHAERVNGIIKNDYIKPYNPQNFRQLKTMLAKAVTYYNYERPHGSLKNMTPASFDKRGYTYPQKIWISSDK